MKKYIKGYWHRHGDFIIGQSVGTFCALYFLEKMGWL